MKRIIVSVVVVLFMAGLLMTPSWGESGGQRGQRTSLLQQGLKFYSGKTLTFIAPVSVGGGGDLAARALVPALEAYLHATVNVEDIPAGNTIAGQDALAAAPSNGLTIGELHQQTDLLDKVTNAPGLNFDPAALPMLGGSLAGPVEFVASTSSPYQSLQSIKNAPTPPVLLSTGGGGLLQDAVINGVLGVKLRIISSYSNIGPLIQGFDRGDGPLIEFAFADVAPLISGGLGRPILTIGPKIFPASLAAQLDRVQTLSQYLAKYPLKTKAQQSAMNGMDKSLSLTQEYAAPRRTPSAELTALRAAFKVAIQSSSYRDYEVSAALKVSYLTPQTTRADFVAIMRTAPELTKFYNLGIAG